MRDGRYPDRFSEQWFATDKRGGRGYVEELATVLLAAQVSPHRSMAPRVPRFGPRFLQLHEAIRAVAAF